MENASILTADILDILFEGRNKSYGAYELRRTYDRRIVWSVAGTLFFCLLFIIGSILANGKKKVVQDLAGPEIELKDIKQEEPKVKPPKELPKEQPKIETAKVTVPKIVADELVKEQDEIKEVDKLADVKIGTINQDGIKSDDVVSPPVEKGVVTAPPKQEKDIDEIYITVEKQAEFPGGAAAWRKYLESHLNRDLPSENGAPPADYRVIVSFIVDRNGVISDVKAENDPGYGTKAEAIRVIQKGPNWMPAEQNGHKVVYRQKQNITFRVEQSNE